MQRIIRDHISQGVSRSLHKSVSIRMSPFIWYSLLLRRNLTNYRAPQKLANICTSCTFITCTLRTNYRRPNERCSSLTTSTRSIHSSNMDLLKLHNPLGLKHIKHAPIMNNLIQQLPFPTSDDLILLDVTPLSHK